MDDLRNFELFIYGQPEFNMDFTTPYDYLGMIANTFPINRKDINKIYSLLDFSYTISELMLNTAEEIIFGCILFILDYNPTLLGWIMGQSFSQEKSLRASQIIKYYYE